MKKFFIALFSIILLLFIIIITAIINYNSDRSKIKRIDKDLELKYNATFEYVKKVEPPNNLSYYQFAMSGNSSILIQARAFWYNNSGMSVIPFYVAPNEWGYIEEDFPYALREYIVNKECGEGINLKQMSKVDAVQKIYNLLAKVISQMEYYIKDNDDRNNYIDPTIVYDDYKKSWAFNELDKKVIEKELNEIMSDIEYNQLINH